MKVDLALPIGWSRFGTEFLYVPEWKIDASGSSCFEWRMEGVAFELLGPLVARYARHCRISATASCHKMIGSSKGSLLKMIPIV